MREVGGIRCDAVLAVLSDYIDGQLSPEKVAAIETHLRGCPECERFGNGFGHMVIALQTSGQVSEPFDEDLWSRIESALDESSP